jgi:hypothetical protein
MRGRISPKVLAMMIRNAVAPLVAMLTRRAAGAVGPTICEMNAPSSSTVISPQ